MSWSNSGSNKHGAVVPRGDRAAMPLRARPGRSRRGQSLVEFALVALVLYLLLAAILTFGHMIYCAQGIQQAADLLARELSRTPLPADLTLAEALDEPAVRERIYDARRLVLALGDRGEDGQVQFDVDGQTLRLGDLPLINQQLYPLMIYDEIGGTRVIRYPGAVVDEGDGYTVRIPVQTDGGWVLRDVVEEIVGSDGAGPFSIASPQRGVAAVRILYPYQSATMTGYERRDDPFWRPSPGDPLVPVEADGPGLGGIESDLEYGPYAGPGGLGRQAAWARDVRPYRRVLSAQGIYRRELFE